MSEPLIQYDELSDTVHVSFAPGVLSTGIELNENVLLRIDQQSWTPTGLVLFNYSVLAARTDLGVRSYPITGLDRFAPDLRDKVFFLLQTPPLSQFIRLSAYIQPDREPMPITSIVPGAITPQAA